MKTLTVLLIAMTLSACATAPSKKSIALEVGDSKDAVIKSMGVAENRQMKGDQEAWQYCVTNFGSYEFTIVWLEKGKVSGINTYTKGGRPFSGCNNNFNSVKWEEAPTITVEHRNR